MTKRLYDNGHILQFDATVKSCLADGKSWAVVLDQTAFFPGGGGQLCDSGRLGAARVVGMAERDGEIVHLLDAPLAVGEMVAGEVDAEPRLRRMQNHSGEHILSGLFHREYGLNNVGFHMGSEDVTLDLDGELNHEQLMRIETAANCIVRQNLPISVDYPSADALAELDYRSKLDLTENVRIVSIGEAGCIDRCACCAPHVSRTGEIGIIKILDHIRYKGGIRIHMLCGLDALEDYRSRYAAVSTIAASLSAKQKEVVGAVERLCTEIGEEKARQALLCQRLIALHTAALSADRTALFFEAACGANELRRLVNAALEITHTAIALSGDDACGYTYVLGSRTQACRTCCAEMHAALGGRGGGSDAMVQGRIPASRAQIEAWWENNCN
ncbi:MAG: alanyl-tRNA editing protein [Clostridia bacterium]|nr:alanyl-tRNA editing protein [Clostridia bacterium]